MADVRNSGLSNKFVPYDDAAAKKTSQEHSKNKKNKKDAAADGIGTVATIGGDVAKAVGYGEAGGAIKTGGDYVKTGIKTEAGIQYGAETGDRSATLTATLQAAKEANGAYQSERKGEGGFSNKSRANANVKQAAHASDQATSLEGKVTKAKESNPDIVGKDGTIDTSTSDGKRAYRQAARADDLRAKEKTYTARAGDLDARSKPSAKTQTRSSGGKK